MDEVLRLDIDRALIILRGKNVLEVNKFDYSKHPEAKKLQASKASAHIPEWKKNLEQSDIDAQESEDKAKPPKKRKPAKPKAPKPVAKSQIVTATKDSILSKPKKED